MSDTRTSKTQEQISIIDDLLPKGKKVWEFEDVLNHVGGWGRYQKSQLIIFLPLTVILAYVCYSPILFLYTPDHWCSPDPSLNFGNLSRLEIKRLTIPRKANGEFERCKMYSSFDIDKFNPQVNECKFGWEYNFTGFFHTKSTEVRTFKSYRKSMKPQIGKCFLR